MRRSDVQSIANERGHMHHRQATLERLPKSPRVRHTSAGSSQPPHKTCRHCGPGREEKVVKVLEWGTGPGATTLALAMFGPLERFPPRLYAILKDGADDPQFHSETNTRRHQHASPRVESSQTLPICSGNMRVPTPVGSTPYA
jgi:hypothetical protein